MAEKGGTHDTLVPTVIAICIVIILVWVVAGGLIRQSVWLLLRAEALLYAPLADFFGAELQALLPKWQRVLSQPVKADLSPKGLLAALEVGGRFIRWPIAAACVALGAWVALRSPSWRYRRRMNFEQLIAAQAQVFPRMRPVLHLKGRMTRAQRGNFWWPQGPFEWAVAQGAITDASSPERAKASFNPTQAQRAFAAQLGRRTGATLAFHEEVLFAVFAARLLNRKSDANTLLDAASAGFGPVWSRLERFRRSIKGTLYDWPVDGPWEISLSPKVETLLADVLTAANADTVVGKTIRAVRERHAYVRTMFASLMEDAQRTGIIATNDFIWLKAVDRTLFYVLNDVGRRVATSEAAGVRAHWQAEVEAGCPIEAPRVGAAVTSLSDALEDGAWAPPPAVDPADLEQAAERAAAGLEAELASAARRAEDAVVAGQGFGGNP